MAFHLMQIRSGECRSLRPRFDIATQLIDVLRHVSFILTEELDDPRMTVPLVKAVLKRIFNDIADLFQAFAGAPFSSHRHHFKYGAHRNTIIEQQALAFRQILHPRQEVDK